MTILRGTTFPIQIIKWSANTFFPDRCHLCIEQEGWIFEHKPRLPPLEYAAKKTDNEEDIDTKE